MYELQAKSKIEAEMKMYGSIGEWGKVRAEDFIDKIADVKAKGYEKLKLKINSGGGSQIEGIAIMSQMGTKEIFIHGVVEGMAASMACIILQGCHKRSMVKAGRLMVHQGAGGVFGSANYIRDYADLVDSMNKTLAEILAKRSKRDVQYILDNWMKEGKDTWFSAKEALEEGLIDEIIEGNVVPLEKEQASLMELAAHYQSQLDTNENLMNKEELIKLFGLKADATEAEVKAAVEAAAKKVTVEPPKKEDTAANADKTLLIDGLASLAKERGADEKLIASIKKVAAIDYQAGVEMLPAAKTGEEKTPSVNELIAALKGGSSEVAADRKNWKLSDWMEKDSQGLHALAKDKPAEYIKLFKAEYGYEPTVDEITKLVA